MSKNGIIPTNSVWYKFKNFFKKIFFRLEEKTEKTVTIRKKEDSFNSFSLKDTNIQNELADKLINQKISVVDLTENEIDTMLEHFKKLIKEKNNEYDRLLNLVNKQIANGQWDV